LCHIKSKKNIKNNILFLILVVLCFRFGFIFFKGFKSDLSCFKAWSYYVYKYGTRKFYDLDIFKDYPPGYIYILYLIGFLRDKFNLTENILELFIKFSAIISDVITSIFIFKLAKNKFSSKSFLIFMFYVLNPAIIFNSSVWGQIDSIYTLILVLSINYLIKNKIFVSCILFCLAILTKPQSLILSPVILFKTYDHLKENNSEFDIFKKTVLILLSCFVFVFLFTIPFTQNLNYSSIIDSFIKSFKNYDFATVNACNLYMLLGLNYYKISQLKLFFLFIEIISILLITIYIFYRLNRDKKYHLACANINLLVFLFTLKIHERYIYPSLIFFLIDYIYSHDKKTLFLYTIFSLTCFLNLLVVYLSHNNNVNFNYIYIFKILSFVNLLLGVFSIRENNKKAFV
jgi:Gpi18-like mannosyltransferase